LLDAACSIRKLLDGFRHSGLEPLFNLVACHADSLAVFDRTSTSIEASPH
jgi:hypothetical protein